jgi:SAM-dependent methyltransferase
VSHLYWHRGIVSGEGSLPIHTKGYIKFIQKFIAKHKVKSVVDLGCGDWQFTRYIDWGITHYSGIDVVSTVIDDNNKQFSSSNIEFLLSSGNPAELPNADLLIAKDVLQHWLNVNVKAFLPLLGRYSFSLLTNCINPQGKTLNTDIQDGGFRYLDLRLPPFSLAEERSIHLQTIAGSSRD